MTEDKDRLVKQLQGCLDHEDPALGKDIADRLVADLLILLGYANVVELWLKVKGKP